ncbi:MAG: preprotein translocase subunit SecY [Phycisphaeraceae bacterium]|nr:preprotein translocase subunit SecY [Phycisphaeraceae bacterium]
MFATLNNIFSIRDLRNKILFTFAMLLVFRIGHWIPLPGINQEALAKMMKSASESSSAFGRVADFVTMFSGGSLSHSTIFGLGVMPYITAGIIFQLVATVSPRLKKLQEEGPTGRQKVMEWTRYVTVALCIVQAAGWIGYLRSQDFIMPQYVNSGLWWTMAVATLTAGTIFLMWIGEQIDRFGIGNGVSMIIMAGILAGMPQALLDANKNFDPGNSDKMGWMGLIMLCLGFLVVVGGSVLMTIAQRRIPVQQAKHTRGRRVFGGQKSYLPLRINHGGVMPIIFASSLMMFPSVLFAWIHEYVNAYLNRTGSSQGFFYHLSQFLAINFTQGEYLYVVLYIVMVYFFSYFWITVQFNPQDMSKQLKEHGSFIPGLRPGPRTAEYLETVITRVTFVGAAFLSVIAILPVVVNKAFGVPPTVTQFLGGTGLLIVVSVCMDFLQKVEAQLLMRNYAGFLSEGEEGGPKFHGPRG